MRTQQTLFRLSAAMAIGGLVLGPLAAQAQQTQEAAQAAGAAGAPAPATGDPPGRVGRLASMSGTVSFHTADQDQWQAATLNYPVTSGNAFWTEPQASAAIEVGATHIAMNGQTEFDVDTLDDTTLAATEPQGEIYMRIPQVAQGETYTVVTPRGSVAISGNGRFDIVAGDTDTPTSVTVVEGSAQVTGPNLSLTVGAHQTATINGTDNFQGSVGAESDDAFLTAQLQAEQQAPAAATANATATATATATAAYTPPAVVQQMTGSYDLQTQGDWSQTQDYGEVWYPPVQQDWVPYRDGHWGYVAPWGWTWIDNSSWGFAPFHYGRWVQVGNRWGWTPGEIAAGGPGYYRPVYAPALVNFIGIGAAVAVGAAVGVAVGLALSGGFRGNVGWAPLGYREPYIPPYYVSRGYLGRVNQRYVPRAQLTNITNNYTHIYNNNRTVNNTVINNYYGKQATARFANSRAATFVPAAAMARSEPVARAAVRVSPQELARARPVAAAPVRPTAQTIGATPAVLRRENPAAARAAQSEAATRKAAPGPAVRPMPARAPGQPGGGAGAATAGAAPGQRAGTSRRGPAERPAPGDRGASRSGSGARRAAASGHAAASGSGSGDAAEWVAGVGDATCRGSRRTSGRGTWPRDHAASRRAERGASGARSRAATRRRARTGDPAGPWHATPPGAGSRRPP